jgi:FtsH-binding integral membrane protein
MRLSSADKILERAKSAAQQADEHQLNFYQQASGLYAQIGAFQTYLLASSTLFVTFTVGAWAAILASDLKLQRWVEILLLAAHLLACVWLTAIVYGTSRSIRARFVMFDALGSRFLPRFSTWD